MTLEEKLKVCSICKNRKHSIKEGLVCGKAGTKPAFADECPDLDIDIAEQERLNIRQRQREGIDAAKAKGKHMGRPKVLLPDNRDEIISDWKNKKITETFIYKTKISR